MTASRRLAFDVAQFLDAAKRHWHSRRGFSRLWGRGRDEAAHIELFISGFTIRIFDGDAAQELRIVRDKIGFSVTCPSCGEVAAAILKAHSQRRWLCRRCADHS